MEVEKEIIMVEEGAHNRGTQVFDADGGIQVFDADGGIRRLRNDIQHYRHKDLMDLEKSQMQLSEMFMDLSIMIESQGEKSSMPRDRLAELRAEVWIFINIRCIFKLLSWPKDDSSF